MSRYEVRSSSNPTYKMILGHDPMLGTFFAQVYKKGRPKPVLWLGAAEIITDLEALRAELAPYGGLPLTVWADLIRDQARDQERPLPAALGALIAFSRRTSSEAAVKELDDTLSYYLLINQSGCHARSWAELPTSEAGRDEVMRQMVYGAQDPLPAILEMATRYFRDPSLLLLFDGDGSHKRLPLTFALPRHGAAYPGPVGPAIISYLESGMPASLVRQVLSAELFVLDPEVQTQATELYYRSPLSRLTLF